MGIYKLNPEDFANLKVIPRELSAFWKTYFAKFSVNMSRYLFRYLKENVSVKFINREVLSLKDYLGQQQSLNSVHPFHIYPHNEIGLINFSPKLINYLVHSALGGTNKYPLDKREEVSEVDVALVANIISGVMDILTNQFAEENREIVFELDDDSAVEFFQAGVDSNRLVSVQQFIFQVGAYVYDFDVVISNSVLDRFSIVD